MNNRLLLVNAITLLYRESQLPPTMERSQNLVRNIVSTIKLPEQQLTLDPETEILAGLKSTALAMCDTPQDHVYEPLEIMQRMKVVCGEDQALYEAFEQGVTGELAEGSLKRTCLNIRRTLQNYFREEKVKEILHKAGVAVKFNRESITDMKQFVAEVCAELEPYQQDAVTKDPAIVSHVSFSNLDSMTEVFKDIQQESNGNSILRTGWQGINRMLRGGFRRGEQVVIGALQHKYKTGFTLSIFKHLALYNVPEMIDPAKKPLLLRISFEDDINNNMRFLYTSLKENETGIAVTDKELEQSSPEEIAAYVKEKMGVNGYHIEMLRVDPTKWSYMDICNKIIEYEADGYEIHALILDYLYMVPTTGCSQGPAGHDVRDMFRRMRNFTNPRKITCITPHQLSTEAKQLVRDGKMDFVKEIANKGYYAGSRQIDQEVDLELYIHIEIVNGQSWLTVQRGKHRIVGQTPLIDQYCVLPFQPVGGILDDINGPDSTRRKVGGGPIGSSDETPWYATLDDPLQL
jgi:hypothetical protein